MHPVLSVIVACRNNARDIPALFESLLAQSLRAMEVVVIDDCSDDDIAQIVETWSARGLAVRFFRAPHRLYTKEARLYGLERASADVVAFADADDFFLERDILERHVDMFLQAGCDTLQFRTLHVSIQTGERRYNTWTDPFAMSLRGPDIFHMYARGFSGHVMWNKLYSRHIWMKCLETARGIPITVCQEDLFLTSLYLFHARHYIGSTLVGYAHNFEDKTLAKSACRAQMLQVLRHMFIPWLRDNGCAPPALDDFSRRLDRNFIFYVNAMCIEAVKTAKAVTGFEAARTAWGMDDDELFQILLEANALNAGVLVNMARMV